MNRSLNILLVLISSLLLIHCSSTPQEIEIENPASEHGKYPRLFTDNTGTVFMSWMETVSDTTFLYYAKYTGEGWTKPMLISSSDSWFVNWADFPSIIAQNGKPMASHWLQKKPGGTYSYDVAIATYNGSAFSDPLTPHTDNTPTEHGFVSMQPISEDSFYAIWLDGRNMKSGHGHVSGEQETNLDHAMTLRGAVITPNKPVSDQVIDQSVCECCGTTLVNTNNTLIAAYRNRSVEEIRDIYVSTMNLDTGKWTEGKNISNDNWKIAACPVNGPVLAANDKLVALAWFTGANDTAKVKLRTSTNLGESWHQIQELEAETPLGRVDVAITSDNVIWVTWMSRSEDSAVLKIASFDEYGKRRSLQIVDQVSASRSGGFPQLEVIGNSKILAWTDVSTDRPRIKTKIIR